MRLAFACPYYGPTPNRVTTAQLAAVMHVAWQHPWVKVISTRRMPHVPACETILRDAIKDARIDAVFWTEDDVVLPPNAVTRLVRVLEASPETDVATGIVFMRTAPHSPMIAHHADTNDGERWFRFISHIDSSEPPQPCDAASMGCLLLRRSALDKIGDPTGLFDTDAHHTTPDFAFFDRMLERGVTTLYDPGLLCVHLGEQEEIDFDSWVEQMEALAARGEAERIA